MDGSIWERSGEARWSPRSLFLVRFFVPFFSPPGSILGWFWEAKTPPKIVFLGVLFRMRFFIAFLSFFDRYLECFFSVFEVCFKVFYVLFLFIFCSVHFLKMLISYWFLQCFVDVGFLSQRCLHIRFYHKNALKIHSKLKYILGRFCDVFGSHFRWFLGGKIYEKSIKT